MPQGYSQSGKSCANLQAERDRLRWPYRTATTISVWFILGGYIYAPEIFTSEASNLKPTRNTLIIVAAAMLIIGYICLAVTALWSRSLLFNYECIALPLLTSSVGGMWAIVMNHALHKTFPVSDTYIEVPLVLSSISTVFSICLSFYLFWRIKKIRRTDSDRPTPLLYEDQFQNPIPSPGLPYQSPGLPYGSPGVGYSIPRKGVATSRTGDAGAYQGLLPQQYSGS